MNATREVIKRIVGMPARGGITKWEKRMRRRLSFGWDKLKWN